ncbi:MAG: hypothetical protein V1895_01140, partial [Parcubacteria group bacterium]
MKRVNKDRWLSLSLAEQLGNIGAEFTRASTAARMQSVALRKSALGRAMDLIDCTLTDERLAGRRREILRLREVV